MGSVSASPNWRISDSMGMPDMRKADMYIGHHSGLGCSNAGAWACACLVFARMVGCEADGVSRRPAVDMWGVLVMFLV